MFIFSAMITNAEIKSVKALHDKKNRLEERLFIVEGHKMVAELLQSSFKTIALYATDGNSLSGLTLHPDLRIISEQEMKKISALDNPSNVLAVAQMPENSVSANYNGTIIALDNVQDPGNLGNIIRTADWFGVDTILCSENTVDAYNPKVVQATMGSLFRVNICYCNLEGELTRAISDFKIPVYATTMEAPGIYDTHFEASQIILFGNEGKGLSDKTMKLATHKISIPAFAKGNVKPESLNVASSVAIVLAVMRVKK
jgi:TrmH family RNA methyltransferase